MNLQARRGLLRGLLIAVLITTIWLGWAIAYLLLTTNSNPLKHSHPKQCECIHNT